MALGKYNRLDKQSSSPFCFRASVVFFVAACILAVWMLNSSSSVPPERQNFNKVRKIDPQSTNDNTAASSESSHSEEEATKTKASGVTFEDNPGDLPDDAIKGDGGDESDKNSEIQQKPDQEKNDEGSSSEEQKKTDDDGKTDNNETLDKDEKLNSEKHPEGESEKAEKPEEKNEEKPEVKVDSKTDDDEKTDNNETIDKDKTLNSEKQPERESEQAQKPEEKNEEKPEVKADNGEAEKEIDSKIDEIVKKEKKEKEQPGKKAESNELVLPNGEKAELLKENNIEPGNWETQAAESKEEKERQQTRKHTEGSNPNQGKEQWKLCNSSAGADYIPCLDNEEAIKKLHSRSHFEHRERHCPEEAPTCLVPLPQGYKTPIRWPQSRDKIWFSNVPHTQLAEYKKTQNWVRIEGEYTVFPGGGTQFKNGALHYIDFIQETIPDIAWGNHTRVILDVGCGVASLGGFLFDRDVLAMSLAPKDEHEAQVQLALERGIPAISAVMGTQRLPFPSAVFDIVHCARCRVKWHADGGRLLLELNRMLRPGGYFVWSATPVYQDKQEDVEIWKEMSALTASICWELLSKKYDNVNEVGVAIYRKPVSNDCYQSRKENEPPMCKENDDSNAAWYVPMESCLHKVPTDAEGRGTQWPENWPQRLDNVPFWVKGDVRDKLTADTEYWKRVVNNSYLQQLGIAWDAIRNVMDMRAVYGGFAAALTSKPLWVMNVVPIDAPNTLPIIYERGLFGIHHDWCESFSTYPRTYDLLHADHLFTKLKKRCNLVPVIAEVDRILRPGGSLIVREKADTLKEVEDVIKSLHFDIRMTYSQNNEGILHAVKTTWRPTADA
eukprot:TRINITY_DN8166_c0_g4_i2.p1 TRINITY_DN8166_c0_g4~~TRINITY_DN8166_c0_g4_i2.p1  ORF type:complete len:837 (-),score=183.61 TRINITY_DN8166_c0_g4_i2:471-2981(-)